MIRNLDPSAEMFLVNLARIRSATERAQRQISSGLRVASPSDAPDQVSDILQLHADIERVAQIHTNLGRVKSEVDAAERALQLAVQFVDRARVLASQGAGTTETAENRRILAGEVQGLLEQLVTVSRTIVEGRYVFSGDRDMSPAYELDQSSPSGVNRLFAVPASRQIQHPSGASFVVAKTAGEIFDHRNPDDTPAPDNVFAAVNSLRVALENNDEAQIAASLPALRLAGEYLNVMLSFYGTVQNRIDSAIDTASKLEAQLKIELGGKRDADLAASILELQQGRTHEEAALGARARMPRTSLFDFLA